MELINKATLVAKIEKLKTIYNDNENIRYVAKYNILVYILSFIDTLKTIYVNVDLGDHKGDKSAKYIIDTKKFEMKEVNLDEEVDRILEEYDWNYNKIDFYKFAKHFFELGLKAQKGE